MVVDLCSIQIIYMYDKITTLNTEDNKDEVEPQKQALAKRPVNRKTNV